MPPLDPREVRNRIHDLFENEVEGRIVDPERINALFHDDATNVQMDRELKKDERNLLARLLLPRA